MRLPAGHRASRLLAALLVVIAGALSGVLARPAAAGTLLCGVPRIDGVSPQIGHPGDVVTVSGAGFASYTCGLDLKVGGQSLPVRSQSDSSITFSPGAPVNGAVTVTLTDPTRATNVSNGNLVYATVPTVNGVSPATPVEGQQVAITGQGFTFGGLNPAVSGTGCQSGTPSVRDDGTVVTSAPGNYCNGGIQLTFRVVTDTSNNTVQPVGVGAGSINIAPSVAGVTPSAALPGTAVTVTGSGFGPAGAATVSGVPARASWQDHAVAITVPTAATSGDIALVRSADGARFPAGAVTVSSQITSVSPPAAAIGDAVTIAGAGFGGQTGSAHLGALELPVRQWSPGSIQVTVPSGAVSGPLSMRTVGTSAPAPASLVIVPRLTAVAPGHAQAGALLLVRGTSLGAATGSVSIAGRPADIALWADQQISVTVPSGVPPGRTSVVVAPAGGPAVGIAFTVDAGALPPAAAAAALAAAGIAPPPIPPSPNGPIVSHGGNVDFHPQRKPPSPINLTLIPSATQADPGATVSLTASLVAYGKPVPGATIELLVVVEPGADVNLSPSRAVSDRNGQIRGSIHLSSTAGDHILLARSGQYSDEIRIRGGSDTSIAGSTGATVGRSLAWAIAACALLFILGLGLNLATSPGAARAGAEVWRRRPPGPRGLPIASLRVLGAVTRAAFSTWRHGLQRLAVRLRHLRSSSAAPLVPPG